MMNLLSVVKICRALYLWSIFFLVMLTAEGRASEEGGTFQEIQLSKLRAFLETNAKPLSGAPYKNVHPHMLQLQGDSLDMKGNLVRSFTHTESEVDNIHPLNKMMLRFNLSSIPITESFKYAELRIFHGASPSMTPSAVDTEGVKHGVLVKAYYVVRPDRGFKGKLIGTKVIDASISGTAVFDVSRAIRHWLKSPQNNKGIFLEVNPIGKSTQKEAVPVRLRRNAEVLADSNEWTEEQPILVLHTDDDTRVPVYDKTLSLPPKSDARQLCTKHNMYIDFQKLGWDSWIVQPIGFSSYYCQGTCHHQVAHHMNTTNHAVMQSLMHSRYPVRVPAVCCVPNRTSPLSVLYRDENNNTVLKSFKDMIVETCACR